MNYKSTILKVAVHIESANPVFGEGVTHINLEDESGGAFIILSQEDSSIRLDIEELEFIAIEARRMHNEYEKNNVS